MAGCGPTPSTTERSSWTVPRRAEGDPIAPLEAFRLRRQLSASSGHPHTRSGSWSAKGSFDLQAHALGLRLIADACRFEDINGPREWARLKTVVVPRPAP